MASLRSLDGQFFEIPDDQPGEKFVLNTRIVRECQVVPVSTAQASGSNSGSTFASSMAATWRTKASGAANAATRSSSVVEDGPCSTPLNDLVRQARPVRSIRSSSDWNILLRHSSPFNPLRAN